MTTLRDAPNVVTITAGQSFADSFARGILEQAGDDPLKLSETLILLPSRRACRTLREAFLRLSGGKALLLPQMQPIGDVDADEVAILLAGDEDAAAALDIPPAISPLSRQLLLAQAIQRAKMAQSFDQAVALAEGLGRFLDEVQTENLDFAGLENLVPEEFAEHWQKTLQFLKILTEVWPGILKSRGVLDVAERRNLLVAAQISAWQRHPPQHPVIAAGSTGTIPVIRDLLGVVARLPQGLVVLPGLDRDMDEESWTLLGDDHPQFNLKTLLAHLGLLRESVGDWQLSTAPKINTGRVRLVSEALRPAETTEQWRSLRTGDIPPQALDKFTRIDCGTPQEEADVIALIMREALETPGKTAALITPDRRLARRVSLSLRRWGIMIDDSGGQPLTELPIGAWFMLTAEMAEEQLAPVTLLSYLKHPLMAANMPAEDLRGMVQLLDEKVLRGPRPTAGFTGLRDALLALPEEKPYRQQLLNWLDALADQMRGYVGLMATRSETSFRNLLEKHIRMAETLAATTEMNGAQRLWATDAADATSDFLSELWAAARDVPDITPSDYVSLMRNLLKSVTVRSHYGAHPRLSILGQIEARLYTADMVILGSLNEGTWPALPAHDPWMSRPMRKKFGLPSPERTISIAAHDFVQAVTAPEVVATRAMKVDGTPTVPARWLLRLETVLQALGIEMPVRKAEIYKQWMKDIDTPREIVPVRRPEPRPPVDARPRKLSVTQVEKWMRDPYQIYAQHVLNLRSLEDIDADPGGAERGTFIHAALENFIKNYPDRLPEDATDKLLELGRKSLRDMRIPQEVEAFWWPRFERVADEFVRQERAWREDAKPFQTEVSGVWQFGTMGEPFTLTGKADRIDKFNDGSYAIIDYKSGFVPRTGDVAQGLSPQLPLEALMLQQGAFKDIPAGPVSDLVYWRVTGSGQKPVESKSVIGKDHDLGSVVEQAATGLISLVEKFDDPATPYFSQPRAEAKSRFSDYEHLARVKEWSIAGEEEEAA
ncbi:MAG TPA: double-strand break repair protein AddB [Patescibacteria group bacterium]|nr:double-strand break repair protein AddB [Patescibacteria group bacterium]